MRKQQKELVENLVALLEEAHVQVKNRIEQRDFAQVKALLLKRKERAMAL